MSERYLQYELNNYFFQTQKEKAKLPADLGEIISQMENIHINKGIKEGKILVHPLTGVPFLFDEETMKIIDIAFQ